MELTYFYTHNKENYSVNVALQTVVRNLIYPEKEKKNEDDEIEEGELDDVVSQQIMKDKDEFDESSGDDIMNQLSNQLNKTLFDQLEQFLKQECLKVPFWQNQQKLKEILKSNEVIPELNTFLNITVDVENSTDDSTEYANQNSSFSNISDSQISPLHNENYWYNCLPTKLITTASIPISQPSEHEPVVEVITLEGANPDNPIPDSLIKLRTPQKQPKLKLDKKERISSI